MTPESVPGGSPEITVLLGQARDGDTDALGQVFRLLYDELHRVADGQFRRERPNHTLQPTALVHEAFLRVSGGKISAADRSHFLGIAAHAMRQVLVEHARKKNAKKRGGDQVQVTLDTSFRAASDDPLDVLVLNDVLDRLAAEHRRMAEVVELRLFAGLTLDETAEALGVSPRTVGEDWSVAKLWLSRALKESDE